MKVLHRLSCPRVVVHHSNPKAINHISLTFLGLAILLFNLLCLAFKRMAYSFVFQSRTTTVYNHRKTYLISSFVQYLLDRMHIFKIKVFSK